MGSVRLEKVSKRFGDIQTLHDVDIDIKNGEFVVFVGPSGCGKSTLLRIVAGLEEVCSGEILINGKRVNELQPSERGIAMVFQSYALYPHMTVYENIAFSLKLSKVNKTEIDRKVRQVAGTLQLEKLLGQKPSALSGGQRQRVAIGRAIVRHPEVFLFDEPLSNLDADLRVRMRMEIARLHRELKSTMIYVTHDQVEAMTLADRIVVLNAGQVEQIGTPLELYLYPDNLFVAGFIGSPKMNFVRGKVVRQNAQGVYLRLDAGGEITLPPRLHVLAPGERVMVGVRPEHLSLGGGTGFNLKLRLDEVEYLGSHCFLHCQFGEENVLVEMPGIYRSDSSNLLKVFTDYANVHLFDAEGKIVR